jgi:hypothetical protein
MKGIFEFEVGEPKKTVGFKFGMMALGIAEQKNGKSIKEILETMKAGKADILMLLHVMYGAACQYAENKKTPVDFSCDDVSDWIEEIGIEEMQRVLVDGLYQYVPKNSKSPSMKEGEMITA